MDTLENRLQKRIHISLYALLFLTVLLGISVLLEGCTEKSAVSNRDVYRYLPDGEDLQTVEVAMFHVVSK